ncbi:MAG: YadA-like family protein [Methylocystis sp.]
MQSVAYGSTAAAYGAYAQATSDGATAIGTISSATGGNSTGLGANANTAGYANSTALDASATNTAANQIMLGGTGANASTLVAPGITSAASLSAQSGPTNFVSTDAAGHLATSAYGPGDIANLYSNVASLWQNVAALKQSIQRGYEGTAIALALAPAELPSGKNVAVSGNWGAFRGQNAFGGAAQMRVAEALVLNAGVGVGFQKGGVGGRAGATFAW